VIALLGFVGAIAGKDRKIFASADVFIPPMTTFGIGMLLAAAATGLLYFTQIFFGAGLAKRRFDYDHPYVHVTPASARSFRFGYVLQVITIMVSVGSFLTFAFGLWLSKAIVHSAQL